jgi:hypothetical protein
VRRRDREAAAREVFLEDRDRERGAFVGVRAAPELVEKDEAPRRRAREDPRRARHRGREGREVAEEVLRVARDDEDRVEDGSVEPGRGGDREARLGEQREEPGRLHRDALAARVRARQEQRSHAFGQLEVERHRVGVALLVLAEDLGAQLGEALVEERVARGPEDEPLAELREDAVRDRRELGPRLRGVELREDLDRDEELGPALREARRERDEDAVHFLALFLERLGERVVVLDDGERLDEERLARARLLVHEALHGLAPVRAHGQAVAPALSPSRSRRRARRPAGARARRACARRPGGAGGSRREARRGARRPCP